MTIHDLLKIIAQKEGSKIEFKLCTDNVPSSLYETVVSFSNAEGGVILLGVNDDGQVNGVNPLVQAKLQRDIVTALNSPDCVNPSIYVQPILIAHPEGSVIVIEIPPSSQVHDHKRRIYYREFESDLDITNSHQRVSDLYLKKRSDFSESHIYPALTMDDLDPNLFLKARELIRSNRGDHPWLFVSDEQILRDSVLLRKDFTKNEDGLTLGAALLFGKDTTIQSILPAYKVEAMVKIQNVDQWDDRINPPLRTNLIDTYTQLKQFINKHLPERFYLMADQRVDLRDRIFREIISNVILHRDYTSALSTEIIIKAESVTITNPNKPHFMGPIDPNSFNPFPKNPNLRKLFNAFGWADEIGSGIRNLIKYLPLYVQGAQPHFVEGNTFRTEIPLCFATLGKFTNHWITWLDLPTESSTHLQKGLTQIPLPTELSADDWPTVLLYLIPGWSQKGTKSPSLDWPKNQPLTKSEIEKIPAWSEKGTRLLHKKVRYILAILSYCAEPISLSDLMLYLDYKNRKTFRENYMKPLEQLQWIVRTNPDSPFTPDQKYRITEKGKEFLGGRP
ncbi:MAG TPA: RNA-binding domain-containing protein [Puia sp.]|nr:RNA-binding domain-containing protein [Puia sp.]